jgi:predicted nucleic acid-binding protein
LSPFRRPAIVLDTNVVLDWLLFSDPSSASVSVAIMQGHVRWLATAAMRVELSDVLGRGLVAKRNADPRRLLSTWDTHADMVTAPERPPGAAALHCSDPDDQKFLDLALGMNARWLLSRDRAVLTLASKASAHQLCISVPERWVAPA